MGDGIRMGVYDFFLGAGCLRDRLFHQDCHDWRKKINQRGYSAGYPQEKIRKRRDNKGKI